MHRRLARASLLALSLAACHGASIRPSEEVSPWEAENPVRPLPGPPLGVEVDWRKLGVTPEKVRLGRWLFFDPRLSADGTVSCATCHRPEHAFSEPTAVSTGIRGQRGTRKAPPIVNAATAVYPAFFWDGRARSLADQAKGPIANPVEMGNTHAGAARAVAAAAGYRAAFREAFGDERVDIDRIAAALAAYEATRLSGGSAYDRYEAGDDSALSPLAKEGRDLFFGAGRCSACHLGPNLTDARFHNIGIGYAWQPGLAHRDAFADPGRAAVSSEERDTGAFKTPGLRDVSRHAPYMHDGSIATLEEVVFYYVTGGNSNPWLAPELREMRLQGWHVRPLVAFLEALDGEGFADVAPASFPR
jgi:cytochrome c peroxidase